MSINYEYYKSFYYAAKYKNMTRAAAALGSSQPNITRVLKLLEAELNCKLFVRESRGIALTKEGERLYAHVEAAVLHLERAQEELSVKLTDSMGTIEIGATETALHLYLLDALHRFKEEHLKVRIRIQNDTTPEILKKLAGGRLDFAVLTTPFELLKSFTSCKLFSYQEILAAGIQYRELGDGKWEIFQLRDYPWVGLGEGTATYEFYREFFRQRCEELQLDVEAATSDLLIPLIQNNFGIGFLPEMLARPLLQKETLVRVPLKGRPPERSVCLVCDRGRGKSMISLELQKYLKADAASVTAGSLN